jgi:hypothetical protein
MGLLAWSGTRRPAAPRGPADGASEAPNPAEAQVHALLESARKGDVPAYLAAFDGPIRRRLEREVDERGRDAFAADLRAAALARKSHAVFAAEADGPETAWVVVEAVYLDRNERQTYRLDRGAGGWLVTEVETVRGHQPKAKFGTQATFEAPEGVPVQAPGISVETGEGTETPGP